MILLVLSICLAADNLMLDEPVVARSYGVETLQYDDCTSQIYPWGSLYMGVWFNTADFYGEELWGWINL
ncbi:hypothetical protein GF402_11550 [Candidatus Fermentibacteria bacterium]|nr:hypothetical protein [Candidatus Fermentibacteria bacterium]